MVHAFKDTYVGNLSIVCFPAFYKRPRIIFLIPNFQAMVRARGHHARPEVIEVNGKHEILMAVREGCEIAFRGHLCVSVTRSNKVLFQVPENALVNAWWTAVSTRLLNQWSDEVGLFKRILK